MESELVLDPPRGTRARRFMRHFFEMVAVMMLGMCVLGGCSSAAAWRENVVLASSAMAFTMTLPMVLWMRYRGHSWKRGGEMAAAMNLPVLPLLVLCALGAISAGGVLGLQMVLMLPAMLGAMIYRKDEYSAPHTAHRPLRRWFVAAR
jgi:hypothetical protein